MNGNLEIAKEMIAEGHAMEAAEWAKLVAHSLPESDARELIRLLATEILKPTKRKVGDKFTNRMTFEKLAAEVATAEKVRNSGKQVTVAFDTIGQAEKSSASPSTVKRRYYKHKDSR